MYHGVEISISNKLEVSVDVAVFIIWLSNLRVMGLIFKNFIAVFLTALTNLMPYIVTFFDLYFICNAKVFFLFETETSETFFCNCQHFFL